MVQLCTHHISITNNRIWLWFCTYKTLYDRCATKKVFHFCIFAIFVNFTRLRKKYGSTLHEQNLGNHLSDLVLLWHIKIFYIGVVLQRVILVYFCLFSKFREFYVTLKILINLIRTIYGYPYIGFSFAFAYRKQTLRSISRELFTRFVVLLHNRNTFCSKRTKKD